MLFIIETVEFSLFQVNFWRIYLNELTFFSIVFFSSCRTLHCKQLIKDIHAFVFFGFTSEMLDNFHFEKQVSVGRYSLFGQKLLCFKIGRVHIHRAICNYHNVCLIWTKRHSVIWKCFGEFAAIFLCST